MMKSASAFSTIGTIVALGLSTATFYRTFIYEKDDLEAVVTAILSADDSISVEYVVTNAGTRDSVIIWSSILLWSGTAHKWNSFPLKHSDPVVIEPGHSKLMVTQTLSYPASALFHSNDLSYKLDGFDKPTRSSFIGVSFSSLDSKGHRFGQTRSVGSITTQLDSDVVHFAGAAWGDRQFALLSVIAEQLDNGLDALFSR